MKADPLVAEMWQTLRDEATTWEQLIFINHLAKRLEAAEAYVRLLELRMLTGGDATPDNASAEPLDVGRDKGTPLTPDSAPVSNVVVLHKWSTTV